MLRGKVVATDDGPDDLRVFRQHLFQRPARAQGSLAYFQGRIGLFLAADASKELVQVMSYSHFLDTPWRTMYAAELYVSWTVILRAPASKPWGEAGMRPDYSSRRKRLPKRGFEAVPESLRPPHSRR